MLARMRRTRARRSSRMSEYSEMGRCCETCRYYLGGGCCRENLEPECMYGEYEAWEERET